MKKFILLISIVLTLIFPSVTVSAEKTLYVSTVASNLDMHISPSDESLKIIEIPGCAELKLIRTEGTWGLVVFSNKCGWVNLSFTRDSYEEAIESSGYESVQNVEVASVTGKTDLYTLPSKQGKTGSISNYSVPNGVVLKILRETFDGWGLVKFGDEYVWVELKNTQPYITTAEQAVSEHSIYHVYTLSEEGEGTTLFSESSGNSSILKIADCVKLTVRKTENNRVLVSYDGVNGWVNIENTTKSFSHAQANAGDVVNKEFEIVGQSSGGNIDIFSLPSDKAADGGTVLGNVKPGTRIFVQRRTEGGWSLVNHNGTVGWIPPGSTQETSDGGSIIKALDTVKEGYVNTGKNKGLPITAFHNISGTVINIPECTKVKVLAEYGDYQYVYCDYGAGWAKKGFLSDSYETALNNGITDKRWKYIVKQNTFLMTVPSESAVCGSEKIISVDKGTELEVLRIVTSGKVKWGLVEIDGKRGWINLGHTNRVYSPLEIALFVVGILAAGAVAFFAGRKIWRKIKLRKKDAEEEQNEEETEEKEAVTEEK